MFQVGDIVKGNTKDADWNGILKITRVYNRDCEVVPFDGPKAGVRGLLRLDEIVPVHDSDIPSTDLLVDRFRTACLALRAAGHTVEAKVTITEKKEIVL